MELHKLGKDARDELFQQPHKTKEGHSSSKPWTFLLLLEAVCLVSIVLLLGNTGALLNFKLFYFPLIPPIVMLWLWGINVAYWTDIRLNYVKVFEKEDRVLLP